MSLRIGREQCPKAPGQRQAYGGCTLCLSAAWKLQFLDGHLHGRDDVPSGVAQRPVKVKYDQFYAHASYSIRSHLSSSPSLSYCLHFCFSHIRIIL